MFDIKKSYSYFLIFSKYNDLDLMDKIKHQNII